MRSLIRPSIHAASLLPAIALLSLTVPADAVPVVGRFTAIVSEIRPGPDAAAPFFMEGDPVVGSFGYDTKAAVDTDPNPEFGRYTFTDTAFLSITVRGATYTTDLALNPITISLGTGPGNPGFRITGGLVPQAQVPQATGGVPLTLGLINPFRDFVFLPSDALPTSTFDFTMFEAVVVLGDGFTTPYRVDSGLQSLSVEVVPEPAGGALLLLGLASIALGHRRRA